MHRKASLLACLAILPFFASPGAAGPLTSGEIKAEEQRLQSSRWVLRPAVNTSVTAYAATDSGEAYFTRQVSPLFSLRVADTVSVANLSGDADKVKMKLSSPRLGKGEITFYSPLGSSLTIGILQTLVGEVLDDPSAPKHLPPVFGNRSSHMLHARGANHLPPAESLEPFDSIVQATAHGFRLCPICFRASPLVPNYKVEKTLGDACAAQFRQFNPLVPDDALNERVRHAGERVLARWVVPLRGYGYRFYVVENEQPNAVACPAGAVFVTTALLSALESDEELEAVLAHEITHVERRHGYRQYTRAQNASTVGGILGVLAGVAVGAKTGDAEKAVTVAQAVQIVSGVAGAIAISGYGRREEGEADSYALAYVNQQASEVGSEAMVNVLAKLKYSDSINGIHGSGLGLFMTHPQIEDRLAKARSSRVATFKQVAFGGYDEKGRLLLTIRLEYQAFFDYIDLPEPDSYGSDTAGRTYAETKPRRIRELQVFASVQSTTNIGDPVVIDKVSVTAGSKKYRLDNKEDTQVPPGEVIGMNFVMKNSSGLLPDKIDALNIDIYGIDQWRRVEVLPVEGVIGE